MNQVLISDQNSFDILKQKICSQWVEKLHIIADFDRTLTKNFVDWQERPSLISILRSEKILWEEYSKKSYELYNKYSVIESDPSIPIAEKKQYMQEWWSQHLDIIIASGLSKDHIQQVSNSWVLELRNGVKEFLSFLHTRNIPIIIMSANGIWWDSIRLYLEAEWVAYPNIEIISNTLIWWEGGYAIWREEPLIHVFNKDETVLSSFPDIYEKVKGRGNVLLLWDSLWDVWMSEWVPHENILKIWFLNKDTSLHIDSYKEVYDVVLTDDADFSFVNNVCLWIPSE